MPESFLAKILQSLLGQGIHVRAAMSFAIIIISSAAIERVNLEFKRRTKSMDSLGEKTLDVVLAFTALRLEYGWAVTRVDLERFENLVSLQRINQIEQALGELIQ